jgi:hypothetical protein
MKNLVMFFFMFACSLLQGQTVFKHTAKAANISANFTIIDNAATNNNPNAVLIITSDYGTSGPYLNKTTGVWYSGGKWNIFNQDLSPMTPNAKFNVMVAAPSNTAFAHIATAPSGHVTIIDHPSLNNNPNAKLLVTQKWENTYNNNPIGIYYTGNRWAIYNQNYKPMPVKAQFNIVMHNAAFVVTASAPTQNYYFFDNASTTNQPNNLVFTTQYWTSVYNANETGVWYANGKWSVFNQSLAALPTNAKFMVISCPPSNVPPPSCEPEDNIRFQTNNVTYAPYGTEGQYRMIEGNMAMVLFPNKDEAYRAVEIVKHYGMNSQCFVGRPNASFTYWLKDGVAPTGSLPNEDCVSFNPNTIEVKQVNGTWKIVDGDHWMFDLGTKEAEARQSFCLIKKYGFTKTCYVGRPDPSMVYLKR